MATTNIISEVTKRIAYNREHRDYDCFISIDGEQEQYIGSAPNFSAAEKTCKDFAFHYYEDNHTPEKATQVVMAAEEIAANYAGMLPALAACSACGGTGRLLGDICRDWGGKPPRIPSVEEQIALIGPADANEYITILDVGLPSGEIIQRHTGDGVPNDWITVSRGDVEIDVQASGIVGVVLGGEQIDNVSLQELDDLRALLALDRKQLCHIADLGPEITEAIEVWYDMPWDECKRIARTVGFAAWLVEYFGSQEGSIAAAGRGGSDAATVPNL